MGQKTRQYIELDTMGYYNQRGFTPREVAGVLWFYFLSIGNSFGSSGFGVMS